MKKVRIIWFWIVAFFMIIKQVLKGNSWHVIMVDIDKGENENGKPVRVVMRAMKRCDRFEITKHVRGE